MSVSPIKPLTIFAPAKINLYLHVTGRLDNGYHTLDSLIGFVDIGDQIKITPAQDFSFAIDGPCSGAFGPKERDASPHSSNLVVQAVWAISQAIKRLPNIHVSLTKNLPIAAGIGGGSSDAAAMVWGLMEWWSVPAHSDFLPGILTQLGADVPVCLDCRPARLRGIGDILDPAPLMNEVPIVLVNPGKPCFTKDVFRSLNCPFKEPIDLPDALPSFDALIDFLNQQNNDLHDVACHFVPEISNALHALNAQTGCALARLSGSGPTCFGLFEDKGDARKAADTIAEENPDWWVKAGTLNRPERY